MSDAIIWVVWVVSGVVITFLTQIFYYHWIEKWKLREEREFSFQKEYYFNMEKNLIHTLDTIYIIDTWLAEEYSLLHWWTRNSFSLILLWEKLADKIPFLLENIHSIIFIYFWTEDSFFEYHGSVDALYNLYSDNKNTWLAPWEWKDEFNEYNKAKDTFILQLQSKLTITKNNTI